MTQTEIAICTDALEAAGVPQRIIRAIVWTRGRAKHQHVRVGMQLSEWERPGPEAEARAKHGLYHKLVQYVHDLGLAELRETRRCGETTYTMDLEVVPPPGWTPKE